MTDYVLVHGAWAGGWSHQGLAADLRAAGHRAVVVELRGLGERRGELHPGITLSDHIDDVCAAVEQAGFDRFVLVGHSYGGMVITGTATRLGGRIDTMAYLDAFLPEDGQSLWDITSEYEHRHYIDTQKFTPGLVAPIIGEMGRKLAPSAADDAGRRAFHRRGSQDCAPHLCAGHRLEAFTFPKFAARVKDDAAWEYHEADCGHDVMNGQREQVVKILLGA
jgi:pimeloyl-ACP methyl ester carboxylesterase